MQVGVVSPRRLVAWEYREIWYDGTRITPRYAGRGGLHRGSRGRATGAATHRTGIGATPVLHFRVFARTGLRLTDVVWTGARFLYVDNTTNRVAAASPSGRPLTPFAAMPRQVEETRCRPSPGAHGFAAGDIYCHAPDNKIYRLSPDGKRVAVFATLPHVARSDGALTFDTVGAFGYSLLAATGRSGSASPGGVVFAIDSAGKARRVGALSSAGRRCTTPCRP